MNELQRKRERLDEAKLRVKDFADNIPKVSELKKFEEDTFWGLFSKNVTGDEMNKFVKELQENLKNSNSLLYGIIKEFGEVYTVFNILDIEYISYFDTSIEKLNAVTKTAEDSIKVNSRTIDALRLNSEKFIEFKNNSAKSIDATWNDVQKHTSLINEAKEKINEHQKNIEELSRFKNTIKGYKHVEDIDVMWEELQEEKNKSIQTVSKIERINESVKQLSAYKNSLEAIVHLEEKDETWRKVQSHSEELTGVNKKLDIMRKEKSDSDLSFTNSTKNLENTFNDYKTSMDKKLMISYIISGILFLSMILQYILTR